MSHDIGASPAHNADLETRLRHALAHRAGGDLTSGADWSDLAGRLASTTRRRQRFLAGTAGLALLVGAAGGYFGNAAASTGTVSAPARGTGSTTSPPTSSGAARSLAPSSAGPSTPGACPGVSGGSSDLGTATRLFIRTTTDGVTIRVYRDAQATAFSCLGAPTPLPGSGGGGNSSSGSSGSTGSTGSSTPGSSGSGSSGTAVMPIAPMTPEVTVELSDDAAVGQGVISSPLCLVSPDQGTTGGSGTITTTPTTGATTTTSPPSQPQQLETGTFGVTEGDPVWWVGVEVASDVTSVQMTFPDGSTDQMAPVGGIAVLAHRVPAAVAGADAGPYVVRGKLELLGAGGSVIATVTLPQAPTPVPVPAPLPTPKPVPTPQTVPSVQSTPSVQSAPSNQSATSVAPGAMVACPTPTTSVPPTQPSGTTEKR